MLQGYAIATQEVQHRVILSVNSLEKCGKSRFMFMAPSPIAYMGFDKPPEDIIWQFSKDRIIYTKAYTTKSSEQSAYQALKAEFMTDYRALLDSKELRTVAIDTGTQLWNMFRMAEFGKLTQVQPWLYTGLNEEYRNLINMAYDSDKNVIISHKNKKRYIQAVKGSEKEVWDGTYEKAGFSEIGFLVQANIQLTREDVPPYDFVCQVVDCAQNGSIKGLELRNEQINFATLATFIFPDTEEADWI